MVPWVIGFKSGLKKFFVALAHGPCTSSRCPCTGPCTEKNAPFRPSKRYCAKFSNRLKSIFLSPEVWVHKRVCVKFRVRVLVPEYRSPIRDLFRSRFPSTGPGSQVRILGKKKQKSPTFLKCPKNFQIFDIHLQDYCWSICHVPWVIWLTEFLYEL